MKRQKEEEKRQEKPVKMCVKYMCICVRFTMMLYYCTAEMARKLDFPRFVQIKVGRIDK